MHTVNTIISESEENKTGHEMESNWLCGECFDCFRKSMLEMTVAQRPEKLLEINHWKTGERCASMKPAVSKQGGWWVRE